nr:CYP315a1 [Phyllotreta striolata]
MYRLACRRSSTFSFADVPASRRLPLLGDALPLLLAGGPAALHRYMDARHRRLGPIFRHAVGPVEAVFVADPDQMRLVFAKEGKHPQHIKPESWLVYNEKHNYTRGLFFMDGEEWLHHRKIMNTILLKGDLSWLERSCDESTTAFADRIRLQADREFPDIESELYKWSLDVILSILVGAGSYTTCSRSVNESIKQLSSIVHTIFENTCKLQLIPAKLAMKYNIKRWRNFEESVTESLRLANELLEAIREYQTDDGLLHKMDQANIDRANSIRIIVDSILSAGDTTAYTMAWLLYSIAKHRNVQNELRESLELDQQTPYLRYCVRETLRLHPVAPFLTRILPEELILCGYRIPAGTLLVMSIYTSGRDPEYFPEPLEFDPKRWCRSTTGGRSSSGQASLPFGIGARSCIGRRIAETQLQMTLAKIVRNFDVSILNADRIEDVLMMVSKPSEPPRLVFNKL